MAANPVASINAQLGLDSTQFASGLGKARGDLARFGGDLDKAGLKVGAFGKVMEHGLGKASFGEAFEKTFSRARFAVLEEGGAKIGIFGTALEALGPAGLLAAGAMAAAALSLEQARKAMEWADEIDRFSKAVGTSAESIQAFDDANIVNSVGLQKGREGLEEFTGVFAKFQAHLGDVKTHKWFEAVGLERKDVANVTDSVAALELVLTKVAKLGNPSNRIGALNAFGLSSFKNVVADGEEGVRKYIGAMKDARAAGGIVSDADIAKAAELNDHVELMAHRIGQDFKKLFIELAPTVSNVADFLERTARAVVTLTGELPDAIRGFKAYAAELSKAIGLQPLLDFAARGQASADRQRTALHAAKDPLNKFFAGVDSVGSYDLTRAPGDLYKALVGKGAALAPKVAPAPAKPANKIPSATQFGVDPARADNSAAKAEAARLKALAKATASMEAVDAATKEELAAHAALVTDIQERADLAAQEVDADTKRRNDKLRGDIAQAKIDRASGERAVALNDTAAAEKKLKIARDAEAALANQELEQRRIIYGYYDQILQISAGAAKTAAERREIELKLLNWQKKISDSELANARADELRGTSNQGQRDAINSRYDARQGSADDLHTAQMEQVRRDSMGPLEAWRDKSLQTAAQIEEAYQGVAVNGLDALTEGITGAITGTETLGEAFHNVAMSIVSDLIRIAVQRSITQPLADALFPAGGGLTSGLSGLVGGLFGGNHDRGGSFVMGGAGGMDGNLVTMGLSKGERVDITRADAMREPGSPILFDLRGAVMTEDLLRQMQDMADHAAVQGAAGGATLGSANSQSTMARRAKQTLGR